MKSLALLLLCVLFFVSSTATEYQLVLHDRANETDLFHWGLSTDRHHITYTGDHGLQYLERRGVSYTLLHTHARKHTYYGYTSHNALESMFGALARQHSDFVSTFVIGHSVKGRSLVGLRIGTHRNGTVPQVRYIGNMHGDEIVGREMIIKFAKYVIGQYTEGDSHMVQLVHSTDLWLLPTMNPDGFEMGRRTNAHGYDLNRNFPDRFYGAPRHIQPEVQAVMDWSQREHFVLSANFHGGDLVANYPYDGNRNHQSGQYTATPDDALMQDLAKTYALAHRKMHLSHRFPSGITNGAAWYVIYGSLQDWNYVHTSDIPLTMELSHPKSPAASTLNAYWTDNRDAILAFVSRVHGTSVWGKAAPGQDIYVQEINHVVRANSAGYYWRLLPSQGGTYHLNGHKVVVSPNVATQFNLS